MSHLPDRKRTGLDSLFPDEVVTEEADPRAVRGYLYPEEEACIARAVDRRKREFTAGRLCARRALAKVGVVDYPLLVGPDRAPIWPPGIVGSISHIHNYCAVAVARGDRVAAVGLDVEVSENLDTEYWERVMTHAERRWLVEQPRRLQGRLAKLVFSAKECAFKCQYSLARRWLEFCDVTVSLDLGRGEFSATLPLDIDLRTASGPRLSGMFHLGETRIITAMALEVV